MNENMRMHLFDRKVLSRIITNKFSKQKAACISPLLNPKKPNGRPPEGFAPGQTLMGMKIGLGAKGQTEMAQTSSKPKKSKKSFVYKKKLAKIKPIKKIWKSVKKENKENSQNKTKSISFIYRIVSL